MREGWTYKKLGDCLSYIKNGANIKQVKGASGIPITRIETLSGGVFNRDRLGYADIFSSDKYCQNIMDDSDILMSHINSKQYIGRSVLYRKEGNEIIIHGMNLLRLKSIPSIVSSYFLNQFFQSDRFRDCVARIRKDAVNQSSMAISDLIKIPVPVPPLAEQERIVAELDLLSSVIDKKKAQLKEYNQLAQSIFYDMFGDPITNENGWEVKNMGEVGELQRGSGLSKKDLIDNGHPCILYGQIHTRFGAFTKKHIACIPQELVRTAKIAHCGDVIMAITSEDVEGSCKSVAWMGDYDIAVGSDAAIYRHSLNGIYVSYYTQTKAFHIEKAKYAKGFKVTHISTKEIANIPIPIPPLSLQLLFAEKIEAIEKQKALVQASIAETETLFNSRMDFYFN